jgi:glycosyltransferase involved in cell wall biosynthesis
MEKEKRAYLNNVSLITAVYNESDSLMDFLECYRNQTRYADEFIIVDGKSPDGTAGIIRKYSAENPFLNITVIEDELFSKKYSAAPVALARNKAIEVSKNEIIAVTDAGCILDKDWLYNITRPFEDLNVDVVSGWYESVIENDFQKAFRKIFLPVKETIRADTFLPSSRSLAFKKKCWEYVGGYPDKSYSGEDTKFDIMLKEKGYKFVFASDALVFWRLPANVEEAVSKYYNYGFGDGVYKLFKYYYYKKLIHAIFPVQYLLKGDFLVRYKINFSLLKGYIKGWLS